MYSVIHRPWVAFTLFFLLVVAMRWGSFYFSSINHDESTYIVIAGELLSGEVYLRDAVDTKPIGIFWLYALLIKLTGGSIIALRVAAAAFIASGAALLAWMSERVTGRSLTGWVAGATYCLACSVYKYYGVSPNTEIYFNVFTIAAVALTVAPRIGAGGSDRFWQWPVAGLLLGLGCIIKPFVAAEALAVGLFALWYYGIGGRGIAAGAALLAGFCVPPAGVYAYYASLGLLDAFYFYTFEVAGAYPIELPWYLRLKFMGDYLLRYAPFVLLGARSLVRRSLDEGQSRWIKYILLQFLLVSIVVLLTGKRFGHYQIQLHPVLALWAGLGVAGWRPNFSPRKAMLIAFALAFALGTVHFFYYRVKPDYPRWIAEYLDDRLAPDETFLPINGFQIAYHLLDRPVPTPYVHSSLPILAHHRHAFQIDGAAEAQRVLADPSVRYLVSRVWDAEAQGTPFFEGVTGPFSPVDTIGGELVVWRR